jgi:predicted permease
MTLLTRSVDSVVILVASVFVTFFSGNIIAFGDEKGITLTLEKSSFAPLSTVHGNQLSVSVKYEVNDKSLANQKINGLMKIYSTNGTLIHSTSFPAGFDAKKKGGVEELKTTIRDPALNQVIANVTFTDLKKTETLSNILTTELILNKSSDQPIQVVNSSAG